MTQSDFDDLEEGDIIENKWTLQLYELKFKNDDGTWKAEIWGGSGVRTSAPTDWYLFTKRKDRHDVKSDGTLRSP